ncbi:MAG: NUDIX hydrolase [Acidimicrobiia bacterium]
MTQAHVGVGAVVINDGRLLLIQRDHAPQDGRWSFPGGHVEFGEELLEAVLRELREETGIEGIVERLLGWAERIGAEPEPYHYVILNFVVVPLDPERLEAGSDARAAQWVDLDALPEWDLADGTYEFLVAHGIIPDARTFSI